MALNNGKSSCWYDNEYSVFTVEDKVSKEDKLAFVDESNEGKLSKLIAILNDNNIQHNDGANVHTIYTDLIDLFQRTSIDELEIEPSRYSVCLFVHLGRQYPLVYENKDTLIDAAFNHQLLILEAKERSYLGVERLYPKGKMLNFPVLMLDLMS